MALAARISSKPAVSREFCDLLSSTPRQRTAALEVNDTRSTWRASVPNSMPENTCVCGQQMRMSRMHFKIGSWAIHSERSVNGHTEYCPMSSITTPRRKRHYGFKYTGLVLAICVAIETSLDIAYGAGGLSISPNFKYHPTVNADKDPAFRILDIIKHIGTLPMERDSVLQHAIATHQRARRMIAHLFMDRRTKPSAVEQTGQSLMHKAFDAHRQ